MQIAKENSTFQNTKTMSLSTTTYVLERRYGNQTRKLIMIAIADYTGDDTGTAWAFIDTLAQRAECSRRSVQEHLQILENQGELEIYRNAGPKGSHRFKILKKSTPPEIPMKRGANPAPHPEFESTQPQFRGAAPARGVQMSAAQTTERGANERRQSAPITIEQEENNREREQPPTGDAPKPAPARSFSPDEFCDLIDNVNQCRPEWRGLNFTKIEKATFLENLEAIASITPEQWGIIPLYLAASHPEGRGAYLPKSRERLLRDITDVLTHALGWHRRTHPPKKAPKPAPEPTSKQPELSPEEIASFFKPVTPKHSLN